MTDAIAQQIREFVVSNFMFGQNGDGLADDQSFLESGIIDSTGVLELIAFVEERFSVAVADDEIVPANLDSVRQLAAFITRKTAMAGEQLAG
jgi:acyl carrier protein